MTSPHPPPSPPRQSDRQTETDRLRQTQRCTPSQPRVPDWLNLFVRNALEFKATSRFLCWDVEDAGISLTGLLNPGPQGAGRGARRAPPPTETLGLGSGLPWPHDTQELINALEENIPGCLVIHQTPCLGGGSGTARSQRVGAGEGESGGG